MAKSALKKEKWTLSFDSRLKALIIAEAGKRGVYPVTLLEEIVRNQFNPFGHTDIADSLTYLRATRKRSRELSDRDFLKEIREWQKERSS